MKAQERKIQKLFKMLSAERERAAGYEQTLNISSAIIAVLLNKLGATMENGVIIKGEDIDEALSRYEVRVIPMSDSKLVYSLSCIDLKGECE